MSSRSRKLKLAEYCNNGYRLWDEERSKVVTSRSVIFDESFNSMHYIIDSSHDEEAAADGSEQPMDSNQVSEGEQSGESDDQPELRRSRRDRKPPDHFKDFEMMMALSAGTIPSGVPSSYHEAISTNKEWKSAIDAELDSLVANKTWEIVDKPANAVVIQID